MTTQGGTVEDPNLTQEKVRLRELLNETHTFRLSLRGTHPTSEQTEKLRGLAEQCLSISNQLNMEHGKALSLEMLFTAKLIALESRGREVPSQDFFALEGDLLEAEKIAISFNDKHLVTRILEGLANIYRRTDQYEKEINTIDKAISVERTVPKTVALLDAYHRVLNYLYEKQQNHTDAIVKANTDYWGNYLWVKTQPTFDRDQFIMQKRIFLYKVAIYVGSLAGNPLNVGEQNPEDYTIAQEAYDEAIYIATLLQNNELLCAAHAHKALMLLPRLNVDQKLQLLHNLKALEDTYHPENEELREMIATIEKQFSNTQEDVAGR